MDRFGAAPGTAFATNSGMDLVVTPLIQNLTGQGVAGVTIGTQPTDADVRQELYNLITLLKGDPNASTQTITMAACTALLSSATTLIK